jgi:hypothetical protein
MKHDSPRSKVTVEDLLRVKRAERPSPDFWVRFEQELRAKQLAAIVEKRPWWHAWSLGLIRSRRWYAPVGAGTALALSVFALHEFRQAAPASESLAVAAALPSSGMLPETTAASPGLETAPAHILASAPAAGTDAQALEPVRASNVRPGEIARVISMMGADSRADDATHDSSPAARLVTANLALNHTLELDSVTPLGSASGFEARGLPALRSGSEAEPLAQMSTPKYRSSARYLTTALPAGYVFETASARPVEPVKNHINDRALREDSVSRVGVDNGGVFWKL